VKQVVLKRLTIEGFKSFTKRTVIDFSIDPGTTFIAGRNDVEPRLGSNGAGKSTAFTDAIVFCQYGMGVRGAKINDLVAHGAKQCTVIAEYEIDGKPVELKRSGPPAHIWIDGERVEQPDVDRLLGLSRQRFLNSVLFGQAMPLFLDMAIPQRGELLDEVLDLQIWMRAADRAGKRCATISTELNGIKVELGRTEGALSALEDNDVVQALIDSWEGERDKIRRTLNDACAGAVNSRDAAETELAALQSTERPDPSSLFTVYQTRQRAEATLREQASALRADMRRTEKDLAFFRDNASCPTCGQDIDPKTSGDHVKTHETELNALKDQIVESDIKIGDAHRRAEVAELRWDQAQTASQTLSSSNITLKNKVSSQNQIIDGLKQRITQLDRETNPHVERLEKLRKQRRTLREQLKEQRGKERDLNGQIMSYEYWRNGFRKVRLFCIERVLKVLELETMNAAQSLGLVGWKIGYATETETKSGTTKLGVQVEVSSPTRSGPFINWSGGEGQRVRLAGALGLAGLIQRWSGVLWNIEVYDEPTAFLSESGIEDLLELLKHRADSHGKSIFIADHRGLGNMGFDHVMTVVKDSAGSRIEAA
jgi:DNA repair exonuclease SbcCD ATPase subunit